MGFTFLPRGIWGFSPGEKCEAPWGEIWGFQGRNVEAPWGEMWGLGESPSGREMLSPLGRNVKPPGGMWKPPGEKWERDIDLVPAIAISPEPQALLLIE